MALLWLLGLGFVIYLLAHRRGQSTPPETTEYRLAQRNIEWAKFIAGYQIMAATKSEKALIDKMLADIKAQGLIATSQPLSMENSYPQATYPDPETQEKVALAVAAVYQPQPFVQAVPKNPKVELDNASLLLYFGAFLFVASVGLFIVFGGANGAVRTVAVLLVMGIMYVAGIYLFRNKPKLVQAGLAFSGMGMTIAPLAGVAAYNYLFHQTNGPAVWFVTSLMCMAMYIHAMWVFRRPLVSYILIFTFLSLFESGVSIITAPIYYFGWAMALVGIILSIASRFKGFWPEMQESSRSSSQLLLPLAVLASLALVPMHGAGQLGVSLLLAAAFYGLEALNSKDTEQRTHAITAHITALVGIICLSYSAGHSWKITATVALIVNIVQAALIIMAPKNSILWRNFASVLLGSALVGLLLAAASPGLLLAAVTAVVVASIIVWQTQQRTESYVLAALALMALPLVFGQYYVAQRLGAIPQASLLLGALLIQLATYMVYKEHNKDEFWVVTAHQVYVFCAALVLMASLFASPWGCVAISAAVVATIIILLEYESDPDWAIVAGVMAFVPVIRGVDSQGPLVAAHLLALLLNIGLALWYRKELNRWFSTVLWLALPLSLGAGLLGGAWTATSYAWAYVLVMMGLILSRSIARGAVLMSNKVLLASYAKTASFSYVFGYWAAAVAAVSISMVSSQPQIHATAILAVVTVTVYVLSRYIEKRSDMMAMLPLLAQAILWSVIRPENGNSSLTIYLIISTLLAVVSYFGWPADSTTDKLGHLSGTAERIKEGGLASVFIAPAAVFVVSPVIWPMPLGLLVAGVLLYYHARNTTQANREAAGTVMVAAMVWFMWLAGIREVQAYSHVVVALLAFYAYWRATRGETAESDQYLMFALGTATLPLAFQALGDQAGGLYGWWLLLEQIAIMLIGMSIKKRVVTLWGLYVAVGAVLYQLRNLGWAALTVLAMFVIGIAIYKLQRHVEKN